MAMVSRLKYLEHQQLPGIQIMPLQRHVQGGKAQEVVVTIFPNAVIPRHTHSVDAEMIIVAGSGTLLTNDNNDGQSVSPGDLVSFEKERYHGFEAGDEGLIFISRNGGIVDDDQDHWDINFSDSG